MNSEMNKCDLLKRAAKSFGIEPQLECVATQTEFCMETVQADAADVMTTKPDDLYVAYRYILPEKQLLTKISFRILSAKKYIYIYIYIVAFS
jgi:hypothetical protein